MGNRSKQKKTDLDFYKSFSWRWIFIFLGFLTIITPFFWVAYFTNKIAKLEKNFSYLILFKSAFQMGVMVLFLILTFIFLKSNELSIAYDPSLYNSEHSFLNDSGLKSLYHYDDELVQGHKLSEFDQRDYDRLFELYQFDKSIRLSTRISFYQDESDYSFNKKYELKVYNSKLEGDIFNYCKYELIRVFGGFYKRSISGVYGIYPTISRTFHNSLFGPGPYTLNKSETKNAIKQFNSFGIKSSTQKLVEFITVLLGSLIYLLIFIYLLKFDPDN